MSRHTRMNARNNSIYDRFDFHNLKLLKKFLTENGKITPARFSSLAQHQQKKLARAIKQARFLALLPYKVT